MWTMPWRSSCSSKYSIPKSATFFASVSIWMRLSGSSMPCERSVVGTLWSTTARVRSGECTLRPAMRSPSKGLRTRHLVHQVPIDVEQRRAVGRGLDDVVVPDLVVQGSRERARGGHVYLYPKAMRFDARDLGLSTVAAKRSLSASTNPVSHHSRLPFGGRNYAPGCAANRGCSKTPQISVKLHNVSARAFRPPLTKRAYQ